MDKLLLNDKENLLLSEQKPMTFFKTSESQKKSRPALIANENLKKSHINRKPGKLNKDIGCSIQKDKKWKIFDETTEVLKKYKSTSTQTKDKNELVCSEKPTDKYWELLAEERRVALSASLQENEKLAEELETKNSLIEDLKIEIEHLEEVASHTEYLSSIIHDMMKANELRAGDLTVPSNTPDVSTEEEANAGPPCGVLDRNEQFHENIVNLSDGSCSHDSDKENKPPLN